MEGTQSLVALGGLGLVGVNFWTSAQREQVAATVWNKKGAAASHKVLTTVGGELVLVLVLVLVAGQSDSLANGMLAVIASLWVLWAMQHYGNAAQTSAGSTGGRKKG